MYCAWLFLFYLGAMEYREVNGFGFDDLDFARSAIEDVAKSITSKPPSVKISFAPRDHSVPLAKHHSSDIHRPSSYKTKASGPDAFALGGARVPHFSFIDSSHRPLFKTKTIPSSKPRNLNKFNEAMDQVERAMAQAELSRKTAKLTDLKKEITDAVKRGNVR